MTYAGQDKILGDARLLARILDAIPTPVFIKDSDLKLAFLNTAACAAMGFRREDMIGKSDADFFDAGQVQRFVERDRHVLATGDIDEVEEVSADGSSAYLTRMSRVLGDSGEAYILGVNTDLTEIRKREKALEVKEARYRALAETTPVGIWQVAENGSTIYVNPALLAMLGLDEAGFAGLDKQALMVLDKDVTLAGRLARAGRFETDLLVDGKVMARALVVTSGWILSDESGERSAMVTFVDITEINKLHAINDEVTRLNAELSESLKMLFEAQDEILQKSKLSQLGQLTATVAHELRNPLGAVRTSAFILQKRLQGKEPALLPVLQRINNGVVRCDEIITQLLDFSRSRALQLEKVVIDSWLEALVREEADKLPRTITIDCALNLGDWTADIDAARMNRVFINLISNAAEAMVGKGEARIDSKDEPPTITITTARSARGIEISVRDNGPGIPPEIMEKIFEPLFTTKSFGTGLGVPAVKNILEQHGGGLEVTTEVGKGACFTAWIPERIAQSEAA
jgi:PAS domain S-box-containing protein